MFKAIKCVPYGRAGWVAAIYLTCGGQFAITFNSKYHGQITCLYPGVPGPLYYKIAKGYAHPGKFVHEFLYKKAAYTIIPNPDTSLILGAPFTPPCATLPVDLYATVANPQNGCCALPNSYPIQYDCVNQTWPLVLPNCLDLAFAVSGGVPYFGIPADAGWTCEPVFFRFSNAPCFVGTCDITVTA